MTKRRITCPKMSKQHADVANMPSRETPAGDLPDEHGGLAPAVWYASVHSVRSDVIGGELQVVATVPPSPEQAAEVRHHPSAAASTWAA